MAEKLKVEKTDAEIIEYALQKYNGDKEEMFDNVAPTMVVWHKENKENLPLMINRFQLAQVLINGYEIEETPEEKVAEYYNQELEIAKGEERQYSSIAITESRARVEAVAFVITELGHKIKGINE